MNDLNLTAAAELSAMRREFDLSFAQTPEAGTSDSNNFLGIFLGGDPFAIRVDEVAGLYKNRRIAAMPSPVSALLGVTGFRGLIVPVWDLAALLGYSGATSPCWMVLVRMGEPVAFAFEHFEVHFSAKTSAILPASQLTAVTPDRGGAHLRAHLRDSVRTAEAVRPMIHMPSLTASLQQLTSTSP